jgi:hypothetical protein
MAVGATLVTFRLTQGETVLAVSGADGVDVRLDLDAGDYAFTWQTHAPPVENEFRWNLTVSLVAAEDEVVNGTAEWVERVVCDAGSGGRLECQGPLPYTLMRLHLAAGSYRLRVDVAEPGTSAGAPPGGATLRVERFGQPSTLETSAIGVGAALAFSWVAPASWWVLRRRRRTRLEDDALASGAVPLVVGGDRPRGGSG